MRTSIVLDDDLINRARQLIGIKTKKRVIQEAPRLLIQLREQESAQALRDKLHWDGNFDEMRQDWQM